MIPQPGATGEEEPGREEPGREEPGREAGREVGREAGRERRADGKKSPEMTQPNISINKCSNSFERSLQCY